MILVLCVDDNYGMAFNHRRQSRDMILIENMLKHIEDRELWVSNYSSDLFEMKDNITITDDPLNAGEGICCFIERELISNLNNVEEVILYHWNRRYPADLYFEQSLLNDWKLVETVEFSGNSHKKITKEIYRK